MNASDEQTKSLWMDIEVAADAPQLDSNKTADVVIVGSGIAGLSTAYELQRFGLKAIVLDRGSICGGMTARTTAHLGDVCDDGVKALLELHGEDHARAFFESQKAAINRIEHIVRDEGIACNFARLPAYLFPASDKDEQVLEDQYPASAKLGMPVHRRHGLAMNGLDDAPVLRFDEQGRFHPTLYCKGLAERILTQGGRLFANSPVMKVEENASGVTVTTANGCRISAAQAVVATNSPVNDVAEIHNKQAPYRTYAVALEIPRDTLEDALYWDTADPYHYLRIEPGPGRMDYLIVGGEDHKSGEANDGVERFVKLEAWAREKLPQLGAVTHRWSGQVMEPIDFMAYSGRNPGHERIFIHTGDSGMGITHGVMASLNFLSLITERKAHWAGLYDPARKTVRAAGDYISEATTMVKEYAAMLTPGELSSEADLAIGEGAIMRDGLSKLAVYKDENSVVIRKSAKCSHLGCLIAWNSTERCWDCACHGSQFAPDGAVLNGPAISPLADPD